jgi:SagB-type dehydrogenase family enzyme
MQRKTVAIRKRPARPVIQKSKIRKMDRARYRRCESLVMHWREGRLVFENFARRTISTAEPFLCTLLKFCGEPRTAPQIQSQFQLTNTVAVHRLLERLCSRGLLERTGKRVLSDPRDRAMHSWQSWNPAAGFFHFSTKDVQFAEDPWEPIRALQTRAKGDPMPEPLKQYPKSPKIKLDRLQSTAEFPRVLRDRRTWRKYAPQPVELSQLAVALELTFGIQGWVNVPGLGKAAMKTSPSGGSLHPIEAYVLAMNVYRLRRGLYHYNAGTHFLERIGDGISRSTLRRDLGHQQWFSGAAFVILMTAVFGRTQWKYDFARVYRGVLIEAGHLCQTFCLAATWLGLAPFCTIALADTKWESRLGIDGVGESVIYAAGAGRKPADESGAHIGKLEAAAGSIPKRKRAGSR